MEIAPNIFRFDTGPFNWYVVRDGSRLTLVDSGFPGHFQILVDGLRSLGNSIQDIEAVLLTHAHADHMGMAELVRKEANATVYIHKDDQTAACNALQLPWVGLLSNAWRPFVASILTHATLNRVFFAPRIQSVKSVANGDRLDVPGNPRVIHVPGHTPGEVVFHFEKSNATAMGDSLVTLNLLSGRHGDPQLPHWLLNSDDRLHRSSLDVLHDLGDTTMLPGHGNSWKGNLSKAIELARPETSLRG